ncbi:two pore domain potassium channel family protein [Bacillus sp. V3B]|uniref:ion channel n=1 Tax=Bacillus sp. V3B TaxID=2804915 RepID=UPI00210B750D|nr:ion channel [Bacillus sp. V3B]MCQ6277232.1 two pore domain potassium channel family protein [Bacillus sp. V3B]
MLYLISFVFTIYCILMSLRTIFIPNTIKGKLVSVENFLYLTFVYITILLGFGLIYILLETKGHEVLIEQYSTPSENFIERLGTYIYFSAVTLFSVGYGEIAPIGVGRIIAMIEALIGYTIPAAFVAKAVFDREQK